MILILLNSSGGRVRAPAIKLFNCFAISASRVTPSALRVPTGSLTNLALRAWSLFRRACKLPKLFWVAAAIDTSNGDVWMRVNQASTLVVCERQLGSCLIRVPASGDEQETVELSHSFRKARALVNRKRAHVTRKTAVSQA